MDKLLDYQVAHVNTLKKIIQTYGRALDSSSTGCGKTYTSIALCVELNLRPLIICPKSVLSTWRTVLKHFGARYYGLANYESIQNCRYYTRRNPDEKVKCPFIERFKVKKDNGDADDEEDSDDERDPEKKKAEIYSTRKEANFSFKWNNIPNNFILIFDEAHRCKNKKTLCSILLYTAAMIDTMKILMLSATIADKPEKFAIAGYVLKLYPSIKNAKNWIANADHGYAHDMMGVHKLIFNEHASRMRIEDLGDLFPKNEMVADCYDMDTAPEIEEQYKIIEEEVERLKNKEESSACALARILFARMKIEQLKIPTMIKLAKKYLADGVSVAIFVNFSMTLQTLAEELHTKCVIWGEQTMEDRNKNINDFNKDKSHIIICNIKSGGVGISLHDTIGNRRRISLISPSDSAQDIIQVLGRLHRANGKTPVQQFILFCKKTVEEKICENMRDKIMNISALNDGVTNSYKIEGLMDDIGSNAEPESELDRIIMRITVLNMKRDRLLLDLQDVDDELKSLQTAMYLTEA